MSDQCSEDEPPHDSGSGRGEADNKSLSRRQKMSAARLERRRAVDRESQRATRARTKAYITNLEQTIAALEKNSNNEQTSNLMKQIQQKQAEIDRLNALVSSVQKLLAPPNVNVDHTADGQADPKSVSVSDHFVPSNNTTVLSQVPVPRPLPVQTPLSLTALSTPFDKALQCKYGNRNYYGALNTAIDFVQNQSRSGLCTNVSQSLDDDIAIRAVLHGWQAVEDKYDLDLGWQMIRALDQGLYSRSEPVLRLAHLRIVRDTLIHKTYGQLPDRRQLPPYMIPTETQKTISHPVIADYFVWPQVRDYLILTKTTSSNEKRSAWFAVNLRFQWHYELRDVCRKHKETGTYAYSEAFDRSIEILSNWSVATEFYTQALTSPMLRSLRTAGAIGCQQRSRDLSSSHAIEWPEAQGSMEEDDTLFRPFPPIPSSPSNDQNIRAPPEGDPVPDTDYSRLEDWPELNYITAEFGWTS